MNSKQTPPTATVHADCYPSIDVPLHWLREQVREARENEDEASEKKMYVTASNFAGRAEAFQELIDEYKKENPQDG